MTTITLAQPRKVVTVVGDTVTAALDTTPTLGNSVIALVAAHGENLYNVSPSNPGYPWQGVDANSNNKVLLAAYVAQMALPSNLTAADFEVTIAGADRITVHLYEVQAPPSGSAFQAGPVAPGGVTWNDYATPSGTTTSLTFTTFPVFGGDFDMATFFMAAFSQPLANTTTEPTITPDFGGSIGPATDGGRFASEFASTTMGQATKTWNLEWTDAQPDGAIVMGLGQIAEKTTYTLVQRKASLTASTVLSTTPTVGNLLVASLGVTDDEIIPAKTGWNRIVGPSESDGTRICIFWREVAGTPSTTIEFDADNCFGMSVEEWSGFYGSPFVHSSAVGATLSIEDGLGAMAALLPPIGLLDRITYTTIALAGHPDGGVAVGGTGYQAGIAGQRVYAGGNGSSINSNYYPTLGGATWENTTALDAAGLVVVFGDGAEAVTVEAPVDPEEPQPEVGPFVFPDEGSRLAYTAPSRRGGALTSAKGVEGYVYLDSAGTTLASITDLSGDPIAGSLITVGADSKLPLFQGPGTVKTLYIRWANSNATHPIYARNQTAPVDYGSFDPEGFALLAGGNTFSGLQTLLLDLPIYTAEDVMAGAEFTIVAQTTDADGNLLSGVAAARLDLSGIGGPADIVEALTIYGVPGAPTGTLVAETAQVVEDGAPPVTSRALISDLQILTLFTGNGVPGIYQTGTPVQPMDATPKSYVDDEIASLALTDTGIINVRDYGAALDGVTDDWEAIDSALAAALDEGKHTVYIPPGTALVSRTIVVPGGIRLRGAGMNNTTITRPPSVQANMVGTVGVGVTTVEVDDASVFSVGDPIHLWDLVQYEGDDTRRYITEINGNIITFGPQTQMDYDESIGGKVSTSFALICSETDSEHGAISDLTADQNMSDADPKGTFGSGDIQVEFTLATIHLEQCRYWIVERVRFLNAFGDAFSDQGRANLTGSNHNELAWCEIISPFRHGIHLGTNSDGDRIHHNTVTGIDAGYAFFFCADVTNCVIESNYFTDSTIGLSGIDQRDTWNAISHNTFHNVGQPIAASAVPDGAYGLVIDGNVFYADQDCPLIGVGILLDLPNIVFSNNRLHNQFVRVGEHASQCVVTGNIMTGDADYELLPGGGMEWRMWIEAPDVVLTGNIFQNFINGAVQIMGGHRLVARANKVVGSLIGNPGWVFSLFNSDDCVIEPSGPDPDIYSDPSTLATRLIFSGMGDNGANDPNAPSAWGNVSGPEWTGTLVRRSTGPGLSTVYIYVDGSGWIEIGTNA